MTDPLSDALQLLSRDVVITAHDPFFRKDDPLTLPFDGMKLFENIANHPSFCFLTIAFLDHVGDITIANEFKLIHDKTSFSKPNVSALTDSALTAI